jgi:hypothetical protein
MSGMVPLSGSRPQPSFACGVVMVVLRDNTRHAAEWPSPSHSTAPPACQAHCAQPHASCSPQTS